MVHEILPPQIGVYGHHHCFPGGDVGRLLEHQTWKNKPLKLKAPQRKVRSSVTSARSMDTNAPLAQTERLENNCLHRSLISLSFQSSASPAANWDTKLPCALRRRRTRSAIKPRSHKQGNTRLDNSLPQLPCQLTQWKLPQPPPLPYQ